MSVDGPVAASGVTVRRVREHEWSRLRDLRLEALGDPVAHLAFVETLDQALARPDDFWRERTGSAATSDDVVQVVAVDEHDRLAGTVTGLLTRPGEPDYRGRRTPDLRAAVVAVYVRPSHRGRGVLEQLLRAVEAWLADQGVRRVHLHVHEQNERARRAYLRAGYTAVPGLVELAGVPHRELVRELG
ncbi:GNAT family N-acetyltransferase [Aeromicrobium sp. IC_218]|uniref:GNAT family N-acetyltransferase n=1 Tax=Aeromicrobium sp. IC_218 TaxID=2545468 RepID=UPI0013F4873E|nr:GNAT family N-acetyltransferase [Aeromicrobium sp. IC_218]